MKYKILIILIFCFSVNGYAEQSTTPDFKWGNGNYYNLMIGDSINFEGVSIQLLEVENHFNLLKVETDTIFIKVSRHSLPTTLYGVRIFVADNRNVKSLTTDSLVHGLLEKDALICLSAFQEPLLDQFNYIFPVSFYDGFSWSAEEYYHMFSYLGQDETGSQNRSYEGIAFYLNDARGLRKHTIIAIENSTVVWIEDNISGKENEACVLLGSDSQPGIYYVYDHLYKNNLEVKTGQKISRGEIIGTIWGDNLWGNLQFATVNPESIPSYDNRYNNTINVFPQFFELYFHVDNFLKSHSKGRIRFGLPVYLNNGNKNVQAFEEYFGKGWLLGKWNTADRVSWANRGEVGNARISKKLFTGTKASCVNPENLYDYEINVSNGAYRIRARVGDVNLETWQKIFFEGVDAGTFELGEGEMEWTSEKIVRVSDRKLTVRIYIDEFENRTAGISEIVFQQVE